jgi:hypothetical protein
MASYHDLHEQCAQALKGYMAEAQKTCDLLGEHREGPLNAQERQTILAQRQKENEAHECYQQVRKALIEAAKLGA